MNFVVITRRKPEISFDMVKPKFQDELHAVHNLQASGFAQEVHLRSDGLGAVLMVEAENTAAVKERMEKLPWAINGWIDMDIYQLAPIDYSPLFAPAVM